MYFSNYNIVNEVLYLDNLNTLLLIGKNRINILILTICITDISKK